MLLFFKLNVIKFVTLKKYVSLQKKMNRRP